VNQAERAGRAIAVRALLEDPNIKDALASIEDDLVAEWRKTFDAQERDNLWRAVQIMDRLKTWMLSAASHDLTALRRTK
jgi:hypothetical protein